MSSSLVQQPVRVIAAGFAKRAARRATFHADQNSHTRLSVYPFNAPPIEDVQALLRPLIVTSWLIDDFLAEILALAPDLYEQLRASGSPSSCRLGRGRPLSNERPTRRTKRKRVLN